MWSSPEGSTKYFPSVPFIKIVIFLALFFFLFHRTKNTCNVSNQGIIDLSEITFRQNSIDYICVYMYTLKQFNRGEERRFKRKLISDTDLAIRNIQLSPIEETARYSYTRALDEYNAVLINRLARMQPPQLLLLKLAKSNVCFIHHSSQNSFYRIRSTRIRARSSNIRGKFYRKFALSSARIASDIPFNPFCQLARNSSV